MRPLWLEHLAIRSFRNLREFEFHPGPRFNVIRGENGQGKTNLLEAIYVLATSKSFRATRLGELVEHGADIASLRASVREEQAIREQSVGIRTGGRHLRINGERPSTLASYAIGTPIVVFHPGDMALSMGPSAERRKLLDRISLYIAPSSLSELESYSRALKERQRALETRGPLAKDLDSWEHIVARHALAVMAHRAHAATLVQAQCLRAFKRIASPDIELTVEYQPSAPLAAEDYERALGLSRPADLRRGSAMIGPHRDELALRIDAHAARGFASQGQHRAITLSLKSAEIDVVAQARGVRPILLLDDVSSELDRVRTASLFSFLQEQRGQVFLTTTRAELIDTGEATDARCDFLIKRGQRIVSDKA